MPEKASNASFAAQQVALVMSGLECLSSQAFTAAWILPRLTQEHFQPSSVIDLIETDPALTAMAISMVCSSGINLSELRFSLGNALDKLPVDEVKEAFLSVNVRPIIPAGQEGDEQIRDGIIRHSLAVAYCSKAIAEKASPQMDPKLAYYAGLLHDIGKLAIEETMPKGFNLMVSQAKAEKTSLNYVEQENLGIDHTIIGKHLSQKWQFPGLLINAIWFHNSLSILKIAREIPETRIAVLVQLANTMVKQLGIGCSCSYDKPGDSGLLAEALGIDEKQLKLIAQNIVPLVNEKFRNLGLNIPDGYKRYSRELRNTVVQFASRQKTQTAEIRSLRSSSSQLGFLKDFILKTSSTMPVINVAQKLAVLWQKFYQTGKVCLYLIPATGTQNIEAVLVQNLSKSSIVSLSAPADNIIIPKAIADNFAILAAYDNIHWLFEQLDIHFDAGQTRLLPLLCDGRAVGAIAFEVHYPADSELFQESFHTSATIAGTVLALAMESERAQHYAERFVQLITPAEPEKPQESIPAPSVVTEEITSQPLQTIDTDLLLEALAEIADGAAHELNNPLAVIAGRAQLLADSEENQQKKQDMEQIYESANKASDIIEDLMSFAQPPEPRLSHTEIAQLIEEAVQLAARKTNNESLNISIDIADGLERVFVDSAQIVSALANIITNAVESYDNQSGPVKIAADFDNISGCIRMTVSDNGCGMDAITLQKATQPFFSAKPAGRKRGMGLAYAARLIQINKGMLKINSRAGLGTTVDIYLPLQ